MEQLVDSSKKGPFVLGTPRNSSRAVKGEHGVDCFKETCLHAFIGFCVR